MTRYVFLCLFAFLIPHMLHAETIDGIAAVVMGDVITQSEVNRVMAQHQKENRPGRTNDALRREVIDAMIDNILLNHAIEKAKIEVTDDDLARAIAGVLRQNKMTPEQLRSDVASKGMSYETYKGQLAEQIKFIKFTNQVIGQQIKLTDRELRDYYERNKEKFGGSSSNFEAMRDNIYNVLYDEKVEEAMKNFLSQQRQKAYIDIR